MAELKTKQNDGDVIAFISSVPDEKKRQDSLKILDLMKEVTQEEPKMWGDSLIGFGSYHYKYASGREGDWLMTGFSPRKQNLAIYIMSGLKSYPEMLGRLGKHKTGVGCLYIKRLEDIDLDVLKELVRQSVADLKG